MTEQISTTPIAPGLALRRYRRMRALWFALALTVGLATAYAEYRQWLPPILLPSFRASKITPSVIGPCIAQTAVLPLLFGLGLFRSAYFHLSRIWCFGFWLLHGVDLLPCLILAPLSLLLLVPILFLMALLLSRADTIAAAGIRSHLTGEGLSGIAYLGQLLHLWGALLIAQFAFYLTIVCFS